MLDKNIILAPAKLNMFLKILGKRTDGMHFIRTGITFINLHDKITIEKSSKSEIKYTGKFRPINNTYKDCILKKTLKFLEIDNKIKLKILVEKNIPVQGGLGSASTNAASLIIALNNMNIIKIKDPKKYISLGSDIPSFIYNKNCLVTGIGENIYYQPFPKYYFLLVKPNFNNSTKEMYLSLDLKNGSSNENINLDNNELNDDDNGNDFEKIIIKKNSNFKEMIFFLDNLENNIFSRMTGSGSCCYAVFEKKDYAIKANNIFKLSFPNLWSIVCENNLKNI